MSTPLFNTAQPRTPTPEELARRKAAKLARLQLDLAELSRRCLTQVDSIHQQGLRLIWNNPDFTPAEAFEALGPDGLRLVQGSQATTAYLVNSYALAGVPYTPMELPQHLQLVPVGTDGTLTVVDTTQQGA